MEREQKFNLYLDALTELYELLKIDVFLLDNFKTSPALLKHFYLTQLILAENVEHRDLGIKFALLLYRFDQHTHLIDISNEPAVIEILQKQNERDIWEKLTLRRQP